MSAKNTIVTVEIPVTVRMSVGLKIDEDGDWGTTCILDTDYVSCIDSAIYDSPEAMKVINAAVAKAMAEEST